MRKFLIILALTFTISSMNAKENFYPATVTFYNGSQFSGLAKFSKSQKVKFKISEEDEIETLDGYDIKRIIFHIEPYNVFEYIFYKNRYKLLQKIAEGKMSAYAQFDEPINDQITLDQYERATLNRTEFRNVGYKRLNGATDFRSGYSHPFDKRVRFFIKKEGQNTVEDIKLNFRQEAQIWFSDCPEIIEYTNSKEWGYNNIKQIVEFYNEFCGKE